MNKHLEDLEDIIRKGLRAKTAEIFLYYNDHPLTGLRVHQIHVHHRDGAETIWDDVDGVSASLIFAAERYLLARALANDTTAEKTNLEFILEQWHDNLPR